MRSFRALASLIAISLITSSAVSAATLQATYDGSFPTTISGELPDMRDVSMTNLVLPNGSNVLITSTSFAQGGFMPNLYLFNSAGLSVGASIPFGVADSSGTIGDSRLMASKLPGGTYTLVVTQFAVTQSTTATNLSDGFPAATSFSAFLSPASATGRLSSYSLNVSVVPEPSTAALLGLMFGVTAFVRRR